jgi:hypothetical protein
MNNDNDFYGFGSVTGRLRAIRLENAEKHVEITRLRAELTALRTEAAEYLQNKSVEKSLKGVIGITAIGVGDSRRIVDNLKANGWLWEG